ncbi:ABC transporter permease subunit [Helicobacter sp. 13S00477-4]|uniref:ABC transporter permease subunit n=1 Tax=Helicobacter sp. 13S00477-4 TaxID=1905759 RepID=UPI000BA6A1A2|nr:ABC transporter permease subunit [Helicobacter sp. 13S00477-4]PAF52846.1 hypothetical protein BKH44_01305 [Helicobacter sp. 13S00477-4]
MVIEKTLFFISLILGAIFFVTPLGYLFLYSFMDNQGGFVGLENFIIYMSRESLLISLWHTLFVSSFVTIISVMSAFVCAYTLSRTLVIGKNILYFLCLIALFVPSLIQGIGLIYLFGHQGIFTQFFGFRLPLYGPFGIILAQSIYIFPQIFILLYSALHKVDFRLYEQAKIMGISNIKVFLNITLPALKNTLMSAFVIAFSLSFSDFGAPVVVGGNYSVLATDIYKYIIGQQNFAIGGGIAMILCIPAIGAFFVLKKIKVQEISSKATPYRIGKNIYRDLFLGSLTSIILGFVVLILCAIIFTSFVKNYPYELGFTFEHFKFKSEVDGWNIFYHSLFVSFFTGLCGALIVFMLAYLSEKTNFNRFLKFVLKLMILLPMAIPGLVLGIGYALFFNQANFKIASDLYVHNWFYILYGGFALMIICNIVHYIPVPYLNNTAVFQKIEKDLKSVGECMGISKISMIKKVWFPLCFPIVMDNFIYFFLNAMVSISAVIFIYSPSTKLAAISLVQLDDKGSLQEAGALCVLILLVNLFIGIVYKMIRNRFYQLLKGKK